MQEALDAVLALGRKCDAFGEGTLDDGHISRTHAELERRSGSTPVIRDTGSRNGTYVNGSRVQEHPLVAGDIIGMGRALLMVVHEPPAPEVDPPEDLVGHSYAFLATLATVQNAAPRGPTLLWGESGVGKDVLAQHLHRCSGRAGPLEIIRCGGLKDDDHVLRASGGTLVLDNVEELSAAAQLRVIDHLESGALVGTGIVACTVEPPESLAHRLRPELLHRLRRWSIRVPSLT